MKTVMVRCEFNDPYTGLPLYVEREVRSIWYWRWQRVCLFLGIVWRDFHGARIGFLTAWEISHIAHGLTEKDLKRPRQPESGGRK